MASQVAISSCDQDFGVGVDRDTYVDEVFRNLVLRFAA